jgi:hypothetical protein
LLAQTAEVGLPVVEFAEGKRSSFRQEHLDDRDMSLPEPRLMSGRAEDLVLQP